MKLRIGFCCVLFAGATLLAPEAAPAAAWYDSYAEGRRAAQQQELPLLLHFYADWCGPCQRMEHSVLGTPDVRRQLGTRVIGVKVNADREPDVVSRFGISSFPSDVFVSPQGKVLARSSGYADASAYVARIRNASREFHPVRTVAASSPPDGATLRLKGYCPVSIARDHKWRKGDSRFAAEYRGDVYYLHDAADLRAFRADPDKYAPQLGGCDPVDLVEEQRMVDGSIRYGAYYNGLFYLFASRETRKKFMHAPRQYEAASVGALLTVSGETASLH